MPTETNNADRVSYSLSRSIKDYGSGFNVQMTYTTDVQEDETPRKAMRRASRFVEAELAKKIDEFKTGE